MEILNNPKLNALLVTLVEASRNVPGDRRESFRVTESREGDYVEHPGLAGGSLKTFLGDIRALDGLNLLDLRHGSSPLISLVDVTAPGFEYYDQLTKELNAQTENIEEIKSHRKKAPQVFESPFSTYSVTGVIGEGGAGRVFAVKDTDGKELALKCLFPDRVNTERRKRFKNEIDFCRNRRHANIIKVTDWGLIKWDNQQCPFYVMPRFPMTLRTLMEKGTGATDVLPLFSQILDGIEAAHMLGVIHRDVKPENILYDPVTKMLVIADFGIAHFEEDIVATAVQTDPRAKLANFLYSAPEQRTKGVSVDLRADIFALGLILNEMFTRSVPQGAGYATIASISSQFVYLDPLVEKMIQHNPQSRYSSIEEIKKELIGRQLEFVAMQTLDKKRAEVVPTATPPPFEHIKLVSVDWGNGILLFNLNRMPEREWERIFHQPSEAFEFTAHAHPHNFQFEGAKILIPASEDSTQAFVNYFKRYLEMANRGYQQWLLGKAKEFEAEQRRKLDEETRNAEARSRILKNLKI